MMDYNPRLDALRALCVFGVMCFHWQGILQFGWIGVQTFFVLSGFLMTGILTPAKEKYDARNFFLVFQWRRALRIFPAYFGYVFFSGRRVLVDPATVVAASSDSLPVDINAEHRTAPTMV